MLKEILVLLNQRMKKSLLLSCDAGEEKEFLYRRMIKNNIWFTLDLNEASQRLGITKKDFYLMQVNSKDLPEGAFPLTSTYLNVIRNDHLEYAITWYSLAGFLCIIYFLYNKTRLIDFAKIDIDYNHR